MRKDCGDAAETVRKDYGSSADIVRTKCGRAREKCGLGTRLVFVPRPFPAPVLIACSIKTEGKAWDKESRA